MARLCNVLYQLVHVLLIFFLTIDSSLIVHTAELCEALIKPHVASRGTRDLVSKPHVSHFVSHIAFSTCISGDKRSCKTNIINMFHTTDLSA